jgi:hypothetical protein
MVKRHDLARALALAVCLAACGDDAATPTGASMETSGQGGPAVKATLKSNAPPRLGGVSLVPSDPQPGTLVQASGTATDPEGDPVHLRYEWYANGVRIGGQHDATLTVPDLRRGTELRVSVVASDGRAQSDPVTAEVRVGNRPPSVSAIRFEPADTIRPGETVVAIVDGDDPDGDSVDYHYEWRVGDEVQGGDDERFDTSKLKRGDPLTVRVTATDGDDESDPVEGPNLMMGNTAPSITSLPPAKMGADGVYRYAVEAKDRDGDRNLRFRLTKNPDGAKVDALLGEITWKPTFEQTGVHPIEVVVSDGKGGEASQVFEVSVKEVGAKSAPAAAAPPAEVAPAP